MPALRTFIAAAFVASLLLVGSAPASAAAFDSAYQFESAFAAGLRTGDVAQFSVFFANTGTSAWQLNTGSQVDLVVCRADKVTCGVPSDLAAWDPGGAEAWRSSSIYATHAKELVVPGDSTAFSYKVKVPASAAGGSYRFNGDLALAASGALIHPEGYYQEASVASVARGTPPTDLRATAGDWDRNGSPDDVRLRFTPPAGNTIGSYDVQRAPGSCSSTSTFESIGTATGVPGTESAYDDLHRLGTWCYRLGATDPVSGTAAFTAPVKVTVFGSVPPGDPISNSAVLTRSQNFASTLDQGDQFQVRFSKTVDVADAARIRVSDGDGTVADIICGSHATCVTDQLGGFLTVSVNTANLAISSPGAAFGIQFPATITDSAGIVDGTQPTPIPWNVNQSTDRTFGPLNQ